MSGKTMFALVAIATALGANAVQAQVTVDVSKITCDQYVHSKISTPAVLGPWLSGYFHGRQGSMTVDPQTFQANVSKLQDFCYVQDNWNTPVIKAVEQLMNTKK